MKRKLQIVNIDGQPGVGKTTQTNMLCGYFNLNGRPVLENTYRDHEDIIDILMKSEKFLDNNPDGIVVNNGSIARSIQEDMINDTKLKDIEEKYRIILFQYQRLYHKFGMANILLLVDINACNDRIIKRQKLLKEKTAGMTDLIHQSRIVEGLRQFDNYTISRDMKFHVLETDVQDTMLNVQRDLLDLLNDNFEIKKASK